MRILIADDHAVVRLGLKQILSETADMAVIGEAKNGHEALDLARRLDWDVAVLDYSMPGRSGLDLLKEIKREYPQRPVLVLSMHSEQLHAIRVLKAGGAGYVSKENAGDELTTAIRKAWKGGKYVSPALAEKLVTDTTPGNRIPPHELLSDREFRVMWLLASGKKIQQIAKEMFLGTSTISTYRSRVLAKLGLASNAQLIRYAVDNRLLD